MQLSFVDDSKSVTKLWEGNPSPEELTKLLRECPVGEKDGEALIPAIFENCPSACRGTGESCGGNSPHRLKQNVRAMTAAVYDLDDVEHEALDKYTEVLMERGLRIWLFHTFSHEPGTGRHRARLIIPFIEPIPIKSASQWSQVLWPALLKEFGLDKFVAADPACKDPARIYYLPRKPSPEAERSVWYHEGKEFDWHPLFDEVLKAGASVAQEITAQPRGDEDPTRAVDLDDVRKRLNRVRKASAKVFARRIANGEALTPPPSKRTVGDPTRYEAWRSATSVLSNLAQDWESTEQLIEVLRSSWSAECAESAREPGHDEPTDWDTVVTLFEKARDSAPAYKAQKKVEAAEKLALFKQGLERAAGPVKAEPISEESAAPSIEEKTWQDYCTFSIDKEGNPKILQKPVNIAPILTHYPKWKGTLRFNELLRRHEVHGGPLATGNKPRPLVDSDAVTAADWLGRELNLHFGDNTVWARLLLVCEQNKYNPVEEYLNKVQWDGVSRLDGLAEDYFHVQPDHGSGGLEYARSAFKRTLIAAVARALDPGCKVDTVLIMEGLQSCGKSTSLEILGGAFFSDTRLNLEDGKDSMELVSKTWIFEMSELSSLRRADILATKSFLSRRVDEFRPSYERVKREFPRRCIFIGTTNNAEFLQDWTGNRRFWPVKVGKIDLAALKRDRDQIWAEAVALYHAGEQWHLTEAELPAANEAAEARMLPDAISDKIVQWFLQRNPEQRPGFLSTLFIQSTILEASANSGLERRISQTMQQLGFQKRRTVVDGVQRMGYLPPDSLMKARREDGKEIQAQIAAARARERGFQTIEGGK